MSWLLFCLKFGPGRVSLWLRMKMTLNYFLIRRLSLPLLVEWLPSLKRQSLFWKEDKDKEKSSGQMKVFRLFSICPADIYFILCTHFYFVYCTSRKSLGSDDDFCCGCQNVSDTDNCFQGHSYTKGHTTQRVVCLRPVTDFLFPFRTHSTTCAWFRIGLEKVNWKYKSRDNEIVLQLQEWQNNSAGITFTKSSYSQSELSLRYLNNPLGEAKHKLLVWWETQVAKKSSNGQRKISPWDGLALGFTDPKCNALFS